MRAKTTIGLLNAGRKYLDSHAGKPGLSRNLMRDVGSSINVILRHWPNSDTFWREAAKHTITEEAAPQIEEIADRSEVKRLRARVAELEAETLTSHALKELIGTLDVPHTPPAWLTPKKGTHGITGVPVLLLSDIHFDEVVSAAQIGGVNSYNRQIATKRLQHTFNTTIDLLTNHIKNPKYDGFVLALGGDMVSGTIHDELAETNDAHINQTIIALTDILISGIERLRDKFGRVFVPCVVGNHGRHHKKPRAKGRVFDNHEWLIYQMCARHFKADKAVSFLIPDGSDAEFSVYDTKCLLTHGDQFRGGGGIGGIMVPIMRGLAHKQKRQAAIDRPFDLALMGHWHQLVMTENLIINGSVKGYDEYAYQSNFSFEGPQQALFVIHARHGVTFRMPVRCDSYEEQTAKTDTVISWAA